MRKFTQLSRFHDYYLNDFEISIGVEFPHYFKDFLKMYADYTVEENTYIDNNSKVFKIAKFCKKNDRILGDYGEGLKAKGMGLKIPFAFDYSQKAYCLCLDEADYGAVYLFTLTGTWNNVDGTLEKVCDSFFEFINGLHNGTELRNNINLTSETIKELTIRAITDDEFKAIESKIGFGLPPDYVELMKSYANSSIYENCYHGKSGQKFILGRFCTFAMIETRVDEYFEEFDLGDDNLFKNIGFQLPFAIDGGGYRFCISLHERTYGKIFFLMEELLSIDEQSAHLFLANTLEEFINGLQPENEII